MSSSQLKKLKSAIKNGTEVTFNLSSNLTGNSNGKTKFSHKLLLTNTQVSKIFKPFTNGSSANVKFSKTQLSKFMQPREILGQLIAAIPGAVFLAGKEALEKVYR